ncbi:Fanconi anemia group M protein isoform X2 [Hemitrygon akajei]|uniref:Fanconi anemia group M protein isoform X2 n=1 Tax=Hemitrygon akajei TaxID=2704970 RepID=UPI003BF96843
MSGGRQRTLFQSWGTKPGASQPRSDGRPPERSLRPGDATAAAAPDGFEDGEDDDVLLVAVFEAEQSLGSGGGQGSGAPRAESDATLPGFDLSSGDMWIYPTNWPLRTYQFNMVRAALFQNTLVCLPTGMGKTFIAAVLMYNFYRWYPTGKIVFMAPTKPLVAQQIEACYKVMGIPQNHMAEMTGHTQVLNRQGIWKTRRVFFLTPQVMMNDLSRGACPAANVKCLVVDEAHKALGNHAYCQVVKELCNHTLQFRILALTATPGGDVKAVQQVISNLMIAHLEVRSEDSVDVQPYSHQRHVEKFVIPLGPELTAIQSLYLEVLQTFTRRLLKTGTLFHKEVGNLTKYQLVLSREQFRKNPPPNIAGVQRGMIEGDYAICISLYHGYELLLQMGMWSLYTYLEGIMDGSKGMTRACNELCRNAVFMEMYEQLKAMFSSRSSLASSHMGSENKNQFIYSHPKLKKLEEVVVNHFQSWAASRDPNTSGGKDDSRNTRVMIFSSYRHSVQEIAEMLSNHRPLVQVMTFVGHASGKNTKGFTQKEQLEVMRCFREGGYNVLVSTCVGEEGLDIGEVDLIICFDAQKSPIRMIQRMGRTGRKREGRIVVLLAEGREERTYNQSQCSKRSIYKTILGNGNKSFHLYANSPRMVPNGLNPVAHKMYITTGEYESNNISRITTKHGRKSGAALPESFMYSRCPVNKQTRRKEDGLLTSEEFEIWDRKFRLKNDLREPKLILLPFEFVKDGSKDMEQESGNIRELSLTEWSLWQNHPLSTHLVDHSDRCQHFISIMDMIDLMRQEESGCGYSLEIMPYLNRNDVFETAITPQSKFTPTSIASNQEKCKLDQLTKPMQERKKFKNNCGNQNRYTLVDEDEESSIVDTSKIKRSKGFCSSSSLEVVNSKETKESALCVAGNYRGEDVPSEDAITKPDEQICLSEGETEVEINNNMQSISCFDLLGSREILEDHIKFNLEDVSSENRSTNTKPKTDYTRKKENRECDELNNVDSGHDSQLKKSAMCERNLSKLFYLPASVELQNHNIYQSSSNSSRTRNGYYSLNVEHSNYESEYPNDNLIKQVPASIEIVLENVTNFLNTSPPRDGFPFLEEGNYWQSTTLETAAVNVLNPQKSGSSAVNIKSPALMTRKESVTNEPLTNHGNAGSSPSWDDLFDNSIEYLEQDRKAQSNVIEEEIFNSSHQCHNKIEENKSKNITLKDSIKDELLEYNNSLSLFEDNLSHTDLSTLCIPNNKTCAITKDISGLQQQSTVLNEPIQNVQSSTNKTLENGETKRGVTGESLLHENICVDQHRPDTNDSSSSMYNCCDELFSVNFDLGFSFEDIAKDGEASMTNTMYSKSTECSKHFAEKSSENAEIQDEFSNVADSELFVEAAKLKREYSTPISSKHASLQPGKMDTWPCNEIQPSTTQDLFSPIPQHDRQVFFTSSPAFASITPERKSSPNFRDTTFSKALFKNSPVTSQNAVIRNVTENIEAVKNGFFSELEDCPDNSEAATKYHASGKHGERALKNNNPNIFCKNPLTSINGECNSESDEDVIRRPNKRKFSSLESPEVTGASDVDSPILAVRKQRKVPNLGFTDSEDDDFRATSSKNNKDTKLSRNIHHPWSKRSARYFLDEEAELSSEGAENVSSDEDESNNIADTSLKNFINDESQFSQFSKDIDMQEIYLKSVRSPNVYKKKMVYTKNNMAIFSQIPEQDETYLEDSFCVREEDENQTELSDDDIVNFDLIGEEDRYLTRHRIRSKKAGNQNGKDELSKKKKSRRIVLLDDSSEEELDTNMKCQLAESVLIQDSKSKQTPEDKNVTLCSSRQRLDSSFKKTISKNTLQVTGSDKKKPSALCSLDRSCMFRLNLQSCVSETLDFQVEQKCSRRRNSTLTPESSKIKCNTMQDKTEMGKSLVNNDASTISRPGEALYKDHVTAITHPMSSGTAPLQILVDSREISSGPNLVSSLRIQHGIKAEICSLNGCDYIVSERMVVERIFLLEFASSANRSKFIDRIQHLQAMFERICVIVEKDRSKPGDTSRTFQRTKYYDSLLSALTTAGIRILFSSGQEETAGLLAELARVEERKNAAITVPLEVSGLRQQILQFYLSIPDISYITALNLCHLFSSVKEAANSSVAEIAARAKVSHPRAEKIYRYLHYLFDPQMVPDQTGQTNEKRSSSS